MIHNTQSKTINRPNLFGTKVNKTTLFMLPALNLSHEKTGYKLLKYFGLVNCYISHKQSLVEYPDSVSMVFNPSRTALQKFGSFYEIYRTYPNFVTDYVVDQNLVVLVFKVKDKWKESYKRFKESQYSKMSKDYAELFKIPDLATGRVHIGREYHIINRTKDLREHMESELGVHIDDQWELMDPLDLDKEIFDYEFATRRTLALQPWKGEREAGETEGSSLYIQPA